MSQRMVFAGFVIRKWTPVIATTAAKKTPL